MDGTIRYWLGKVQYVGWIYIAVMTIVGNGVGYWHLILIAMGLFILQNYLSEQD